MKEREIEHTTIWMKTRHLLLREFNYNIDNEKPDDIKLKNNKFYQLLTTNKNKIINSFGSFDEILKCFIQYGNQKQLNNIYNSLKEIKLNSPSPSPIKDNNDINIDIDMNKPIKAYCGFDLLSSAEISWITGFLKRKDIGMFKLSSFKISIICLGEMTKHNIAIYNINQLIYHQHKNYDKLSKIKHNLIYYRYQSSIKYSTLFQLWEKYYNIPESQQLICSFNTNDEIFNIFTNKYNTNYYFISNSNISSHPKTYVNTDRNWYTKIATFGPHLLFDTKNIIVLTNTLSINMHQYNCNQNSSLINPNDVNFVYPNSEYSLLFLKYFDIMQQRYDICNILLIQNNVTFNRLFTYIQNEFICDNYKYKWYNQFKIELNKMNEYQNETNSKFVIYDETKCIPYSTSMKYNEYSINSVHYSIHLHNIQSLMFGFNPSHSYIIKKQTENDKNDLLNTFYSNFFSFIADNKRYTMYLSWTNDQKWHLKYVEKLLTKLKQYHDNNDNNDNKQQESIEELATRIKSIGSTFAFNIDSRFNMKVIRNKIEKKINCNFIKSQNIEIYSKKKGASGDYNNYNLHERYFRENWKSKSIRNNTYEWRLVLYDSSISLSILSQCIYRITIYLSRDCENAVEYYAKRLGCPLFVKFSIKFRVSQLVNYLDTFIRSTHEHNEEFNNILPNLNNINNVLTFDSFCYGINDIFINNDIESIYSCVIDLNLYIMKNIKINFNINPSSVNNRNIHRIYIRFVLKQKGFSSQTMYHDAIKEFVGIPYLIELSKNRSLQYVLSRKTFNSKIKNNINSIYKFNGIGNKIQLFSRRSNSYKHVRLIGPNTNKNECFIVVLKKNTLDYYN